MFLKFESWRNHSKQNCKIIPIGNTSIAQPKTSALFSASKSPLRVSWDFTLNCFCHERSYEPLPVELSPIKRHSHSRNTLDFGFGESEIQSEVLFRSFFVPNKANHHRFMWRLRGNVGMELKRCKWVLVYVGFEQFCEFSIPNLKIRLFRLFFFVFQLFDVWVASEDK